MDLVTIDEENKEEIAKLLKSLVGDTGFEPVTSTVDLVKEKSVMLARLNFIRNDCVT